jgi:hypothetical protein
MQEPLLDFQRSDVLARLTLVAGGVFPLLDTLTQRSLPTADTLQALANMLLCTAGELGAVLPLLNAILDVRIRQPTPPIHGWCPPPSDCLCLVVVRSTMHAWKAGNLRM